MDVMSDHETLYRKIKFLALRNAHDNDGKRPNTDDAATSIHIPATGRGIEWVAETGARVRFSDVGSRWRSSDNRHLADTVGDWCCCWRVSVSHATDWTGDVTRWRRSPIHRIWR